MLKLRIANIECLHILVDMEACFWNLIGANTISTVTSAEDIENDKQKWKLAER
jgi:hypothetical protein